MKKALMIGVVLISLTGCYSTKNTAKIKTGVNAAYIAPKGFPSIDSSGVNSTGLSSGAYFFDGSMRMGVSNVIKRTGDSNDYDVKYLAEEQPDVAREFVRTLTAKAKADITKADSPTIKAEAELYTSLTNNIQRLTEKSASLNLSRSILYRFNENIYNGIDSTNLKRFETTADSLITLQNKEFISQENIITKKIEMLSELRIIISEINKADLDSISKDKVIKKLFEIEN